MDSLGFWCSLLPKPLIPDDDFISFERLDPLNPDEQNFGHLTASEQQVKPK